MNRISMDANQLKTYRLGCEVLSGKLSLKEFSILINKSYRQSQRILKKIEAKDFLGVFHGNLGLIPYNKQINKLEPIIVDFLSYKYNGFNLAHFKEKLEKVEHIKISKSTLYRIAKKHGLIKAPRRFKRRSFKPRARLPREGMLIQFDGSEHLWFGETKTDLIAAIDDATGKIVAAEFFYGEKSMHSLKVIKEVIDKNGIPEAFYMDQAGIYGKIDQDWESQIARAFNQLNIKLILASSPQAKGRVERLFRTLQDRLIADLKLHSIRTIDEANKYLKRRFIPEFNQLFSVGPTIPEHAYRKNVFGNLDMILCKKERRKIGVGNVFSYESVTWLIDDKRCFRGREVNINTHLDGRQSFDIMGKEIKPRPIKTSRIYGFNKRAV
jgi:hypothetical protein